MPEETSAIPGGPVLGTIIHYVLPDGPERVHAAAQCETIVVQVESPMPPDDWEALWQRLAAQPPVVLVIPEMTPSDWDRVRPLLFMRPAPTTPLAGSRSAESASTTAPNPDALKSADVQGRPAP